MVGFAGTEFTSEVRELVEDLNPGGVILFARNIESPLQIARLNHELQRHALSRHSQGLFVGVDQEGGRVRRLPEPFAVFPPALRMASSPEPEAAVRQFALTTARELRLTGFNVDFVPVMDVLAMLERVEASVIGDRSFGSDPFKVSHLGGIVIDTMRSCGVIPCVKHFPGHGGTLVDSHLDLPVDERPLELLEECDLIPFRSAVDQQVEMVMTAHVMFPAMDPNLPVTLSEPILQGLLRGKMAYQGVVVTDDLDMGAVTGNFSSDECALRAFAGGVDLLLVCHSPGKAFSARSATYEAVQNNVIPQSRVEESLARIRLLKSKYAASMVPCEQTDVAEYFKETKRLRTV